VLEGDVVATSIIRMRSRNARAWIEIASRRAARASPAVAPACGGFVKKLPLNGEVFRGLHELEARGGLNLIIEFLCELKY
jgi:hypothetical protein